MGTVGFSGAVVRCVEVGMSDGERLCGGEEVDGGRMSVWEWKIGC